MVHVIQGGPSQKVGVQDGDKIVFVDTANVAGVGINNDGVFKKLRGKKGTKVTIKIKRSGEPELLEFQIIRDKKFQFLPLVLNTWQHRKLICKT